MASIVINSPEQAQLDDSLFSVVKCVSYVNAKRKPFVPSTKNFVESFQFKKIIVDTGCTSNLFALSSSATLEQLYDEFSGPGFVWELCTSQGVAGSCHALKVSKVSQRPAFKLSVCFDILGPEAACQMDIFRIYLSSANMQDIVASLRIRSKFELMSDIRTLEAVIATGQNFPEREYSVLGQSFLKSFDSISFGKATFYFCERTFPVIEGWDYIESMTKKIRSLVMHINVPGDYDVWTDDEAVFLDDAAFDFEATEDVVLLC